MIYQTKNNQFGSAMELLIAHRFNGMADAVAILMNSAMQLERSWYL